VTDPRRRGIRIGVGPATRRGPRAIPRSPAPASRPGLAVARDRAARPNSLAGVEYALGLFGTRDAATLPLVVQHADTIAEIGSDDEFEVGLNALLAGSRNLIDADTPHHPDQP
jgi:hypothetical protein